MSMEGLKFDEGKNKLSLVINGFAKSLEAVGEVGTYGAKKYSPNNWKGVEHGIDRYTDAMYRHLLAEETEGPYDKETEILHAAHAAWNALARLHFIMVNLDV